MAGPFVASKSAHAYQTDLGLTSRGLRYKSQAKLLDKVRLSIEPVLNGRVQGLLPYPAKVVLFADDKKYLFS